MIIALSIVAIFALMWIISHNKIDDFDDIESKMVGYPLPLIPDHQQIVTGQVNAVEEGDTMTATGTTGLHGLYIGNIIASASGLRDEHRLELAIVGYNGTGEAVSISGISGHIRAGAGNFRDMTVLPIPAIRNSVRVEPWSEFVLVLNQHLAPAQAKEFLAALDDKQVQLDLKELKINAVSAANIDRSMPLPLWDAVSLRRRDDIISNRVHVLRVGAATEIKASLGMLVARVDGTTEKRDA